MALGTRMGGSGVAADRASRFVPVASRSALRWATRTIRWRMTQPSCYIASFGTNGPPPDWSGDRVIAMMSHGQEPAWCHACMRKSMSMLTPNAFSTRNAISADILS